MNQTAYDLAVKYCSDLSDETATKAIGEAFIAGFEAGQPKMLPFSDKNKRPTHKQRCLVLGKHLAESTSRIHLSIYIAEDEYNLGGFLGIDSPMGWCAIPESLLTFKP